MKNVVVTGMGIVSCIGSNTEEVLGSLGKENLGYLKIQHMKKWVLEVMSLDR